MNILWRILKELLVTTFFFAIAAFLLIHFLGSPGVVLSVLGVLLLMCFVTLRFRDIASLLARTFQRLKRPSPPSKTSLPEPEFCPNCGALWVLKAKKCAVCGDAL
jgi:UPF0716 family protein affecting phage T7 exclusion